MSVMSTTANLIMQWGDRQGEPTAQQRVHALVLTEGNQILSYSDVLLNQAEPISLQRLHKQVNFLNVLQGN